MGVYAVTGAASGIGAGIALQLKNDEHKVITVDIKNADVTVDLSTTDGCEQAVREIQSLAPEGLDGFVPCAGLSHLHKPASIIGRVNYFAVVTMVEGLQNELGRKQGSVVLISSIAATMATDDAVVEAMLAGDEDKTSNLLNEADDGNLAYSASKRALTRWMRRNCAAYLSKGVRMNAVGPGYIDTPLNEAIEADPVAGAINLEFADSIPMGRRGKPEDIANVVSFLLSDKASFMAGALLFIDGGHDALLRPDSF